MTRPVMRTYGRGNPSSQVYSELADGSYLPRRADWSTLEIQEEREKGRDWVELKIVSGKI